MWTFVARRLITAAIVVFGVVTAIFVLARLTGDPIALMIQPGMSEKDVADLRIYLGLDRSIAEQYLRFLANAVQGDFGRSPWQLTPAFPLVLDRLPATLLLTAAAMALSLVAALLVGTLSALLRDSALDRAAMAIVLVGQSVPSFWLGLMLILVVAVEWHLLPTAGYGTLPHLILPALTLGLFSLARLTRLVRSELLDVLSREYITTARAKGLPESLVLARHALRNVFVPIITVLAVDFSLLMGGAVIVETIFAWPGLGRLMIQAIGQRDFPILQAGVFLIALLVVTTNLAADLLYAWFDPRIRYS
ncbi:MAG: ABC transporter permease [Alphaproteobacteria bacterium]|nr:ABC transporter permease [Alphaproteobacteria bacterium]